MQKFIVAAIQMDIALGDRKRNFKRAGQLIEQAAKAGARIVCLPELFNTGYDYAAITNQCRILFAQGVRKLKKFASANALYLVGGSIAEKADGRIYNTSLLIGPQGDIIGKYRKIHLFGPLDEPQHFTPGEECPVFNTTLGRLGIMLCYDIRFAELGIKLGSQGAQIIFVPAQFPDPRLHHWQVLLQARAIENQLYIVGVNRCGSDLRNSYFGNSMVVDPRGRLVGSLGQGEGILLAEIDLAQIELTRKKLYYLSDRKNKPLYV